MQIPTVVVLSDIWFTADTHFGHHNAIRYCGRPFQDKREMDRVMIENWNRVVKPRDTVYHLGDVSFYGAIQTTAIIQKLRGKKIMIRGNHDKGEAYYLRAGFTQYIQSRPATPAKFEEFFLSHYPYWECYTHDDRGHKFADRMLKQQGNRWLLCGHVHEVWKNKGRCINVGVDQWNFTPVHLDEIRAYKESLG